MAYFFYPLLLVLFGKISPIISIIFAFIAFRKKNFNSIKKYLLVSGAYTFALFLTKSIEPYDFVSIFFSIIIGLYIYFYLLEKEILDYNNIINLIFVFLILFVSLNHFFFFSYFKEIYEEVIKFLTRELEKSDSSLLFDFNKSKNLILDYYLLINFINLAIAYFIGHFFLFWKEKTSLYSKMTNYKVHKFFIYPLILLFILFVVNYKKVFILNYIMIFAVIYFFQGLAVIFHKGENFFEKFKAFKYILLVLIFVNYLLVLIISFIGLLDNWFNFRLKIKN